MLDEVLQHFHVMVKERASDLILRTGHRPVARIEGKIRFLSEEPFAEEHADRLLAHILAPDELLQFQVLKEKDTAIVLPGIGRFRANILRQRRRTAFVFRYVKETVPSMEQLVLPTRPLHRLALAQRGLVLVTGIAGSGKSTTLASLIEFMNQRTNRHIITIEDPIEYVFRDGKCAITQREIGIDTPDYHTALKSVVRQTPDVILVGEMRDLETVSAALTAAETGHLVLSTLHTVNAVQTVERILSFFPPHQHELIRLQLSLVLEGVVSQRLITRRSAAGRVPAVEVMLGTPTVMSLIRGQDPRVGHGARGGPRALRQPVLQPVAGGPRARQPDRPRGRWLPPTALTSLRLAMRGISKGSAQNRKAMIQPGVQVGLGGDLGARAPGPPRPPDASREQGQGRGRPRSRR
jgi:twitching motility protein PilT